MTEHNSLEETAVELRAMAQSLIAERTELQRTARNLDRWQGATETMIAENTRRLDAINGSIAAIEKAIGSIEVAMATIKTKIAMWSAIGGLGAGGIVTAIVGSGLGQ